MLMNNLMYLTEELNISHVILPWLLKAVFPNSGVCEVHSSCSGNAAGREWRKRSENMCGEWMRISAAEAVEFPLSVSISILFLEQLSGI